MHTEKSCGGVVFSRNGGEIRYCVIRQTNGDYGFPKGHGEPGETEQQTALREIFEEVGLRASILEGFREVLEYPLGYRPGWRKQTVYFLAACQGKITCQEAEVTWADMLPMEEARNLLTFPETRTLLQKADDFLRKLPEQI